MKNAVLQTERTYLRELTAEDFGALSLILKDPQVMYAYEGAFDDGEVKDWLDRQIARYKKYGFGAWAVVLKDSDELIGQCGLTMQPWKESELLEIGYIFRRAFWHKGYATETALACKKYAFEKLGAEKVCSIIRDTNIPSRKVAERLGMSAQGVWTKHYRGVDMPHILYSVNRENRQ